MIASRTILFLGAAGLILPAAAPPGRQAVHPGSSEPMLRVSHAARAIEPGEVGRLTVTTPRQADAVRGVAFKRPIRFVRAPDPSRWEALVGIDLETRPGEFIVTLEAVAGDGWRTEALYPLDVAPKEFATRRMQVDPDFVDPPRQELRRIEREARRLTGIFRAVSPEPLWSGEFVAPVAGAPTSSFGRLSIFNGQPRSRHRGTDFRAGEGTLVRAPNAGRVALSDSLYFAGHTVVLDHGLGLYSQLAHLSARLVRDGEVVTKRQPIGRVGATGRVTGPHLHWAIRLADASVDPLSLMAVTGEAARTGGAPP